MKAISLLQPWCSLVAIGAKQIETRSWSTKHRGEIAIAASARFTKAQDATTASEPFLSAIIAGHGNRDLPLGCIVAVATLVDVDQMRETGEGHAGHGLGWHFLSGPLGDRMVAAPGEEAFGHYEPGRYGWLLADVRRLPEPVPCKDALGLWTVPPEVEAKVRHQLGGSK